MIVACNSILLFREYVSFKEQAAEDPDVVDYLGAQESDAEGRSDEVHSGQAASTMLDQYYPGTTYPLARCTTTIASDSNLYNACQVQIPQLAINVGSH